MTGNIFGSTENPAYATVPDSYWRASNWIEEKYGDDVRTLHLPLALGDGIKYDWDYPYQGLEGRYGLKAYAHFGNHLSLSAGIGGMPDTHLPLWFPSFRRSGRGL